MKISFIKIFKNILGTQMLIRVCSFIFNFILLKIVEPSILGFFNVRMSLFYNTIGFISREPIRKLCLGTRLSKKEAGIFSIFSLAISILAISICSFIWLYTWRGSEFDIGSVTYSLILVTFSITIFIEVAVEPIIILDMKTGSIEAYIRNNAILIFTQKLLTILLLLMGIAPILAFSLSQLFASFVYASLFLLRDPMALFKLYQESFTDVSKNGLDKEHQKLLKTFIIHSFLKQFLTDGASFLMTFTNIIPLKTQAVYDAVERLGSLVVRLVLQPFEESAAIYFSLNLKRETKNVPDEVAHTFLLATRVIVTFSLFILAFGSCYAKLVAQLYGGALFIENQADQLLLIYAIYIPVIAANGLSECFAISILNAQQLFSHALFFMFSVASHLLTSYFLCKLLGAKGFIIANILNYLVRIWFNWSFVKSALHPHLLGSRIIPREILPSKKIALALLISWIILFTASLSFPDRILSQILYILIGLLLLSVDFFVFYRNDFTQYKDLKLKIK